LKAIPGNTWMKTKTNTSIPFNVCIVIRIVTGVIISKNKSSSIYFSWLKYIAEQTLIYIDVSDIKMSPKSYKHFHKHTTNIMQTIFEINLNQ